MPVPSTRKIKRELRSSERRLSQSPSISWSQSPPISQKQSPSVGQRQSLPVRQRCSELPPVSLLTNNDYMDISINTEYIEWNVRSLTLQPPPSYDTTIAQESSNVGVICSNYIKAPLLMIFIPERPYYSINQCIFSLLYFLSWVYFEKYNKELLLWIFKRIVCHVFVFVFYLLNLV